MVETETNKRRLKLAKKLERQTVYVDVTRVRIIAKLAAPVVGGFQYTDGLVTVIKK